MLAVAPFALISILEKGAAISKQKVDHSHGDVPWIVWVIPVFNSIRFYPDENDLPFYAKQIVPFF